MGTGKKYSKDKFFTKIEHSATSGVIGDTEYEVWGETDLRVVSTFTTSGTLTVQGRIKHSDSWDNLGTLAFGGDSDSFDISTYDYIRFNFTVAAGSTGEIAASGFFKGSSASGGAASSFTIMQTDAGTSPTADSATDTLTFTSSDSSLTITGNSTTDTIDLIVAGSGGDVSGPASSVDNAIARFDGTTGKLLQDYTSGAPTISDTGMIAIAAGTAAAPTIYFSGDSDTGFFSPGANQFGFSAGGSEKISCSTSRVQLQVPFFCANGAVSGPSYSFTGMTDGGLYRDSGTDSLRMSVNGVAKMIWEDNDVSTPVPFAPGSYATGSLPTASSFEGYIVYDTTTQTMKWSNGTAWATI